MTDTVNQIRLLAQLAKMIILESAIEQRLDELFPAVARHAIVSKLLEDCRTLSKVHRQALDTRLNSLMGGERPSGARAAIYAAGISPDAEGNREVSLKIDLAHGERHLLLTINSIPYWLLITN